MNKQPIKGEWSNLLSNILISKLNSKSFFHLDDVEYLQRISKLILIPYTDELIMKKKFYHLFILHFP